MIYQKFIFKYKYIYIYTIRNNVVVATKLFINAVLSLFLWQRSSLSEFQRWIEIQAWILWIRKIWRNLEAQYQLSIQWYNTGIKLAREIPEIECFFFSSLILLIFPKCFALLTVEASQHSICTQSRWNENEMKRKCEENIYFLSIHYCDLSEINKM